MNGFSHTRLEDGETIVLGVATFSSSGGFSFSFGRAQAGQVSATRTRRVGVTNRRVVIEQVGAPEQTRAIANADVRRVHLKHDKFGGKIAKIETVRNQTFDLDLGGLLPQQEARLNELFPNAEIKGQQHLPGTVAPARQPATLPARRPVPPPQKPVPAPTGIFAEIAQGKSYISDPDIKSLDDLNRHYPLPEGYVYQQAEAGFVVVRSTDGASFGFLVEDEMLGFDVPAPGRPGNKVTVEVLKRQ